jgi:hypothetical protein
MFAVVFVALHKVAYRLTYEDVSISCYNVICLIPVWVHFAWNLWRAQSARSSEVRFCMLIQCLVLLYVHSTNLCLDHSYWFTVKVQTWLWCWPKWIWTKLSNTVHFKYCQLDVLRCAADYQSGKNLCVLKSNGQTDYLLKTMWTHSVLPSDQLNSTVSVH